MTGLYNMREMLKDALEPIKNTIKESDNPYLLRMRLKKNSFMRKLLSIHIVLPLFSLAYMNRLGQSVYLIFYLSLCVVIITIAIAYQKRHYA